MESARTSNLLLQPKHWVVLVAAVLLAAEPMVWLVGTWTLPGYSGLGWLPALVSALIFAWSWGSPGSRSASGFDEGLLLLFVSAVLRLTSQLLAINVLGALLLCVDVYALGRIAGLAQRARPVSPFWLAVCFAFALPLEPMLQRVFGFALQQVSAHLAFLMLWPIVSDLAIDGTRLVLNGRDVFVDLPCSGASLISLLGFGFAGLNAFIRPMAGAALKSAFVALLAGLGANALRVATLSLGVAHETTLGFSVMSDPAHEWIGLFYTGLAFACLVRFSRGRAPTPTTVRTLRLPATLHTPAAGALLLFALTVGAFQPRPLDASPPLAPSEAPGVAADFLAMPVPLSQNERRYFSAYGGGAAHTRYGPFSLLIVETTSPLRHLHDPAVCMRASGAEVTLVGTDHASASTVYRVVSRDGMAHVLRVSYRSSSGQLATSIGEVVWHWLGQPERWTMVQRISPAHLDASEGDFDVAIRRAFNLFPSTQSGA